MQNNWMSNAKCQDRLELPWTAEAPDVGQPDVDRMREVCAACPVLAACSKYAEETEVCSGFWAGEWRIVERVWWRPLGRDEDAA